MLKAIKHGFMLDCFFMRLYFLSFIANDYFFNITANTHACNFAIVFNESLPNIM